MVRMDRRIVILLAVTVALNGASSRKPKRRDAAADCGGNNDVVFVVDSSDNVGKDNFNKEIDFVKQTVNRWNVGPTGMQVGLVTFGDTAKNEFYPNAYSTRADVLNALGSVKFMGGKANTAEAIKIAYENSFNPLSGGRSKSPHTIILVTNSASNAKDLTLLESKNAKDNDDVIYTVGIGDAVDASELSQVSSDPDSRYVFKADSFQSLNGIADYLALKACNELPTDPNFLPAPTSCLKKADLVFMLDSSSSVGSANFQKLEGFLKDFVKTVNVGPDAVHVGVSQFSSYPSLDVSLTKYTNRPELLKAIGNINYLGGGTNTADAIKFMRENIFANGARDGVPHIGILVTDGKSSSTVQTTSESNAAHQNGIGLISVGVGSAIDRLELNAVASDPDSQNVFTVNSYDQLNTILNQVMGAACKVQPASSTGASLGPDTCTDLKSNCPQYGRDVCTQYSAWSKVNCMKFCGQCTSSYTTTPPPCKDALSNCPNYGSTVCTNYRPWAETNCRLYCGLCAGGAATVGFYGKCYYKGNAYAHGEKWSDGCAYECTCTDGNSGKYQCYNKCPVYYNLPAGCTLVTKSGECCLQPVCNFSPTINSFSGSGSGVRNGINVCVYKAKSYYEGQQWEDGCTSTCTCTDASTGAYTCSDLCGTYKTLPSMCQLQQTPGKCCPNPVCEFSQQQGSFSGYGTVTGQGIGMTATAAPPCKDTLDNCATYGLSVCKSYPGWSNSNCRKYCNLCNNGQVVAGANDHCLYNGHKYMQGQNWKVSCDTQCVCENAVYGYYRCLSTCPTYNNLPSDCMVTKKDGQCCPSVQCSAGTFLSSSTNLNTIGNGGMIWTGTGSGTGSGSGGYVAPTLPSGATARPGTGGTGYQAPKLNGCLYNGGVYALNQRWNDACSKSCVCTDDTTGLYSCKPRCPTYPSMPSSCTLVADPNDSCCLVPHCTGAVAGYVAVPSFGQAVQGHGAVQPPSTGDLWKGVGGYTIIQLGPTVPAPTGGVDVFGGIGYCMYKGKQYLPGQTWEDGCDYNCVCDDATYGHYKCVEKCIHYSNLPEPFCRLVPDPANACCKIPQCNFTGPYQGFTGYASFSPNTQPQETTTPLPTPGLPFCVYKGKHYNQGQQWYDGCSYKCHCDDSQNNKYTCLSRCPEYKDVDPSCKEVPDPRDPTCCRMPQCAPSVVGTPTAGTGLVPALPTVPAGSVTGTGTQTSGGTAIGYCAYKGTQYKQGDRWVDGCDYSCVCENADTGYYRCTERCTRYANLPSACHLITDFANPCCEVPRCNFGSMGNGVTGYQTPPVGVSPSPGSLATPAPGTCDYKTVLYAQGQVWTDGCDFRCRCDNAAKGIYTCSDRCPKYDNLPGSCTLVTDPKDSCCLTPVCTVQPGTPAPIGTPTPGPGVSPPPGQTPHPGSGPTPGANPIPYPIPTAVPGKITGHINVPPPTPGPGGLIPTPVFIRHCEYKGSQYNQGQTWRDGCDYNCRCVDALSGKYECTELCPQFVHLPPYCTLVKDPANPCCEVPECTQGPVTPQPTPPGPTPLPGQSPLPGHSPVPGSTLAPVPGHSPSPGVTPNLGPGVTPTPKDVCVYKGKSYTQGQSWYDGCDYKCECEDAAAGVYRCNNRCPSYNNLPPQCTLAADPQDPFCCKLPECHFDYTQTNATGYGLVPTLPPGSVSGGKATPMPTPGPNPFGSPTPGPVLTPYPGYTGTPGPDVTPNPGVTQAPDLKNVCVYKGKTYTQGQRWQDGCEFDCVCLNSATGAYKCTEKCQRYPKLPPQCQMVQDYLNPCCRKPYCDFTPTTTLFPPTYLPGHSPTPHSGGTPTPQAPTPSAVCIYNGVPFQQGDSWNDGCDLKCSCEDAKSGYYRCNHRCLKYDNVPATCVLQTDPRDSCCKVPFCAPVMQSTPAPQPNTPSPLPGVSTPSPMPGVSPTYGPGMSPNPNPGVNPTPNPYPVPTAIPGILTGNGVNPNLNPTDNTTMGCFYKGLLHKQGDKWIDGCEFNCECVDAKKSRYQCLERCPSYNNVPAYCMLVPDPNDACCKVPSCLPPLSVKPTTPAPLPGVSPNIPGTPQTVVTLAPGHTYPAGVSPPVAGTPVPGTPVPQPRDVCTYKGVSYTQGQQFYDGCDKICVCENGKTGFYRCSDRCTQFTNIPSTCTLIADPRDPGCCQVPQCIPSPGQPGYSTPKPGAQPTIATNVPGFVTGQAPVPGPTPGPDGKIPTPGPDGKYPTPGPGMTPAPRSGCDYKGTVYVEGQKWQDGCKYNCVCDDGRTGKYTCNERCPSYPMLPPQCTLATDPKDYCCYISVCDFNKPIATPGPLPNPYPTPKTNYLTPYPGGTYPPGFTPPTLAPGVSPQRPKTPYPGGTYPPGFTPPLPNINGVSPPVPQTPYPGGTYPPGFTPPTLAPGVSPQRPKTPYPGGTYPPGFTPPLPNINGVSPPVPQTPYPGGTYPPGFTPPTLAPGVSPQRPKTPYPGGTYPPGFTPPLPNINGVSPPVPQTPYPGGTYPPGFTPPTLAPGVSPQRPKTPYPGGTYPPGFTPPLPNINGVTPPVPQTPYPGGTYPPGFTPPTLAPGVSPQRPKTPYPGGTYPPGFTPPLPNINGVTPPVPQTPYPGGTYPPGFTPPTYAPGVSPPVPQTPYPGGTYPPGYTPGIPAHPNPVPTIPPNPLAFCVYKGVPYRQGQSWQDGCSQKCRCEDATNNYYTCFDRCPSYNLKAGCTLVTDASDPCCQVPQCTYIPTPMPGVTPAPGSTATPMPGVSPTAAPGMTPYPNPSPLPTAIPGHISGHNQVDPKLNPVGKENFCLYKGQIFTQGQQWDDGCDYHCVCVDQSTGKYDCTEKCGKYVNIPPYCVMVQDPSNTCCKVPSCSGPLNPVTSPTSQPTPSPGATYAPGVSPTLPAGVSPSPGGNPIPSPGTPGNPIPKDVCVFQGKAYTQGQQWYEGCDRVCVCDDAHTGLYSCNVRCPTYNNLAPTCVMVPDPQDPICCKAPKCGDGNSTTGVFGTITGNGQPPTPGPVPTYLPGQSPSPGTGVTPSPGSQVTPPPQKVCVYKGVAYNEGQKWQDGCDFDCVCLDGTTGNYKCTDRCPRYPNLPLTCVLTYDPANPCCKKALCGDQVPTPGPGVSTPKPVVIVNPTLYPGQVPTPQFCIYNGVPFRQGQKWNEGCDKVCRCEDAATKQVNCDDRCPSFPSIPSGCSMATDPNDKCCHIINCAMNPSQPGTSITGVPGVITGHGLPSTSLNPYVTGKRDVCIYNGNTYKQDETWNDGCTFTCVCIDANSGTYQCTEKCPRYPPLPSSCTMVQDKTNACCMKPYCPDLVPTPGPGLTPIPGVSTPKPGVSTPTPGPGVSPSPGSLHTPSIGGLPTPVDVCVYKGQQYKQGQMWYDGCDNKCRCEDAKNNFYRCQQRCAAFASVPVSCTLVPDPKDPMCCEVPSCPLPTPAPGVYPTPGFLTVTAGPTGVITGNGLIPTPKPGQPPLQPGVTPTPNPFVSPGAAVTPSPGSVATPLPKTGCYYKNHVYRKGESWDDGCDLNCICLDDVSGKYKCSEKCQKYPSLPTQCVLIQDPSEKCCMKPYCDFMNPTPFPGGIPTPAGVATPTPVPGINPNASPSTASMIGTGTSIFGKRGFCVYQGVYYNQGEEWNIGCSKTCRCEDVSTGYYSCHERCPSYDNVPSTCHLIASPTDPCCLVPECNNYPPVGYVTQPGFVGTGSPGVSPGVSYPNITGIYLPTNIPGTITGISGSNNNNYIPQYGVGTSGIRTACVYKGHVYSQGQTWNDGCNYKCECIDAARGQYRCSERCPRYYNLPPQCKLSPDPADNCCEKAICDFTPTLQPGVSTTTPTPTSSTPEITAGVAIGKCVYTDGSIHNQGDMWSDGCDFDCKCDDASKNIYTCNQKCQAYSSLPKYCQLQPDPINKCCERPVCTGGITALSGNSKPTASPTLDPTIQNIVPLGTHSVFTGTSQVSAIPGMQHVVGGRSVCVYNGTTYGQGESWDDGCKYICTCKNAAVGLYECTSKCPNFPPIPSYCKMQSIPGQCCPSLTCNVPGKDMYIPVPQLVPTPGPTPDALGNTPTPQTGNQQLLVGPSGNTVFGGSNLPGAGAAVPQGQTISGLRGVCVFKNKMYHQGEKWQDNCTYDCECLDARSGYYSCKPMCPSYDNLPSDCYLVKPNTGCCSSPMCKKPDGTVINPITNPSVYPVFGAYTGGFSGFRPGYNVGYSSTIGGSSAGCVYKGVVYQQGQKWDDGCDYRCECIDATARQYRCNPMCSTYTSLPAPCRLVPTQGCCQAVTCEAKVTPSPSPSTNPGCKDVKPNCAVYGTTACKGEYEPWGRANCAAFCGLCPKPTQASCVDVLDNCAQYGASSCSGAYEPWAIKNCAKTCNKCQTGQQPVTTAVVVGACTDALSNCASFGSQSCKDPYTDWAKANCKRTCGFCPHEQIVTGQAPNSTQTVGGVQTIWGSGSAQGWIILMKGVAGVPGDLYQLWSGSGTSNKDNTKAMDLTNTFKGHYKPNIANRWDECKFDQVKLSIYKNGIEKANIIFNAKGATKDNWMDPSRIVSSTYSDIQNAVHGVFSLKGDANSGREFYASSESNGCDAYGWIMISTKGDCFYEKLAAKPAFYYSPTETRSHWGFTNPGEGDVMTITGHGGVCGAGQTGNTTPGQCLYKGKSYKTGESWQDGCTFNCTCVDGSTSFYRCSDLCPSFSNLPGNCKLEKQPGQCCSTPVCHEPKAQCVYKGRTYSEGQTWDDGCDYTCTCEHATFYQCKTKCLQWNLPDKCHLDSPPAGKCCPVPKCPSGFVINYPPGYTEQ